VWSLNHGRWKRGAGGTCLLDFEIRYFPIHFFAEKYSSVAFELEKTNFTTVVPMKNYFWLPLGKIQCWFLISVQFALFGKDLSRSEANYAAKHQTNSSTHLFAIEIRIGFHLMWELAFWESANARHLIDMIYQRTCHWCTL